MSDYLKKLEDKITNKINTKNLNYLPLGRFVEVRSESSARDYFTLNIVKKVCEKDKVLYIDIDNSLDINFLKILSIKTSNMLIYHPELDTNFFDKIHKVLESNEIRLIVINSILGILPKDKNYDEFKKKLQNLNKIIKKYNSTIIFLNPYDSKRYNILEEFCSIIIYLKKRQKIGKSREYLGYFVDGYILKNTLNLKLGKFNCKVLYNKGLKEFDSP